MDRGMAGAWVWSARRLLVSAFVIVHVTATVLWVLPGCPLRAATVGVVKYYMMPLGLWQFWGMFSPDPPVNSMALEAEVIDRHGLRHNFAFPDVRNDTDWRSVPRFRHPKYALHLVNTDPEVDPNRVFAARHVLRQLRLPAEAFPVDVRLYYQVRALPAPGQGYDEAPSASVPVTLSSYHFVDGGEVRP